MSKKKWLNQFGSLIVLLSLFSIVFASAAPATAATLHYGFGTCASVYNAGTTGLAVRVNPSTNATIITRIGNNTIVRITGNQLVFGSNTWWPVWFRDSAGRSISGWTAGSYLRDSGCGSLPSYTAANQLNQAVYLSNGNAVVANTLNGATPVRYMNSTFGKPGQLQLSATVTSRAGMRTGPLYAVIINQFAVGNNARYTRDSYTYCNTFAGDVMRAMGVPLPTKSASDQATVGATALYNWLRAGNGWRQINPTTSQGLRDLITHVNAGKPALAADAGHVAVIRPGQSTSITRVHDLLIAQAGATNTNSGRLGALGYGTSFRPVFFIRD